MEVVGRVPKLMAMWLSKRLRRPTNPGKVKITGKRVSKSVAIIWSYLPCEQWFLHRRFSPFRSVVSGGETTARRVEATLRVHFQGGTFSCNWWRQELMKDLYYVISFVSLGTRISCLPHKCFVGEITCYQFDHFLLIRLPTEIVFLQRCDRSFCRQS